VASSIAGKKDIITFYESIWQASYGFGLKLQLIDYKASPRLIGLCGILWLIVFHPTDEIIFS